MNKLVMRRGTPQFPIDRQRQRVLKKINRAKIRAVRRYRTKKSTVRKLSEGSLIYTGTYYQNYQYPIIDLTKSSSNLKRKKICKNKAVLDLSGKRQKRASSNPICNDVLMK